jgi:hypothetical protein
LVVANALAWCAAARSGGNSKENNDEVGNSHSANDKAVAGKTANISTYQRFRSLFSSPTDAYTRRARTLVEQDQHDDPGHVGSGTFVRAPVRICDGSAGTAVQAIQAFRRSETL